MKAKVALFAAVGVDQKFKGAETVVCDMLGHAHRRRDELVACCWGDRGAWGNFDQLLMAPLHRAFALPQMRDVSRSIAENLDFDMASRRHEAFDIHLAIAERRARFRLATVVRFLNIVKTTDNAHPATTASGHGFDDDRGIRAARTEKRL